METRRQMRELREYGTSLWYLIKWLLVSIGLGVIVGSVSSIFGHVLIFANRLREQHPFIIFTLPIGGLMIVALYRGCRNTSDKDTNTVVASIQETTGIPFRMAPLIFVSTAITQLCGGSAGREGAALQLGGSIAKRLGRLYGLNEDSQRTIIMCGMSAGFSALFRTPLAAAVFSIEVVSVGIMHYAALVPCVIASLTAHFTAAFFHVPPEVFPVSAIPTATPLNLLKLVAFAAVAGGISTIFCMLLHQTEHLYEKYIKTSICELDWQAAFWSY